MKLIIIVCLSLAAATPFILARSGYGLAVFVGCVIFGLAVAAELKAQR
jgi:hypothetical protein